MSDKDKVQADWLDVFRVAAMVMVFVLHLSQRIISNGAIARFFNNMGFAGVSAFFVLSGYLIPASYERCGTKKCFYIKRIFRILPVYFNAKHDFPKHAARYHRAWMVAVYIVY